MRTTDRTATATRRMPASRGRLLIGLVVVALGVVLLLDAAGRVEAGEVIATWWPAAIIAGGLLGMVGRPAAPVVGGAVAVFGLAALGITTGVLGGLGWGALWAVALVLAGVWIALGQPLGRRGHDGEERLDVTCVFSGQSIVSTADPFTGGSLTGVFGGVELDLTGAALQDGAVIDAMAAFGGVEITVPTGWRVRVGGPAVFGGHENHTQAQDLPPDAPVLDVRVLAAFGGVEVKLAREVVGRVATTDQLVLPEAAQIVLPEAGPALTDLETGT